MKKDIYIIKNSINSKVYIGQSKNAAERWLSHIYNAKYEEKTNKETQVIHKAMSKYGIDKFHYEILEWQTEDYDNRERYWIEKYNSRVPNGYNVATGGMGSGVGLDSPNSVFDSYETLLSCISEISSGNKSFTNLATKYRCSPEVISAINNGHRYRQEWLVYPLRNTDTKYSAEKVKQIRYSLKYERDLSINEIAKKYGVDSSQVSEINQGKIYYIKSESYPLRDKRKTDLGEHDVDMIIHDILYSELAMCDIAIKYNISRTRVSGINQGKFYIRKNLTYPLRPDNDPRNKTLKKFLDIDTIKEIHSLLKANSSINDIAKKYSVSPTTIYNINNGKCKKYVLEGETYPIRSLN